MSKFNGHKNWNHWNVSLWINNDEGLYRFALECLRQTDTKDAAAKRFIYHMTMIDHLRSSGVSCRRGYTPDGVRYSQSSVRAAISGLEV